MKSSYHEIPGAGFARNPKASGGRMPAVAVRINATTANRTDMGEALGGRGGQFVRNAEIL